MSDVSINVQKDAGSTWVSTMHSISNLGMAKLLPSS